MTSFSRQIIGSVVFEKMSSLLPSVETIAKVMNNKPQTNKSLSRLRAILPFSEKSVARLKN